MNECSKQADRRQDAVDRRFLPCAYCGHQIELGRLRHVSDYQWNNIHRGWKLNKGARNKR